MTKNRVRAAAALEADLNKKDIDLCVVSETHPKPEMPNAIAWEDADWFLLEVQLHAEL